MDKINIIIAAKDKKYASFSNYLSRDKGYNIVIGPSEVEEYIKYMSRFAKAIVVLDFYEETKNFCLGIIEALKKSKFKFIMICSNVKEGFAYLNQGVDEIITRNKDISAGEIKGFITILEMKISKILREYDHDKRHVKQKFLTPVNKIIAIGSSTGGTECVERILKMLPENTPPILVVQHMPPVFTELYSQRLNAECKMTVLEAKDGDSVENGKVLIAPGGQQMRLVFKNNQYSVKCSKEGNIGGHEPSVNVLFHSVAEHAKAKAIGIILTGMGKDGAEGLLKMRQQGALTIGQDEASSIVYGMPKAAFDIGAVSIQASPIKIVSLIMSNME